jgi:Tol biopolymer transport system component
VHGRRDAFHPRHDEVSLVSRLPLLWAAAALVGTAAAQAAAGSTGAARAAWDISETGQPYTDVEFTVDEGTWMSVAVSPDGRTVAFDLLGDIYAIPAAGGEATLVHGGPAMQRMPSYSADGLRLLYLSDASGADNAWISNADGSGSRQITHETVDILGSASWGPQDDSIAVVKTYATFPQMKSSEIRLFDLDGGAGMPLVETPENRRDVQEPRFTADGRFVYYTERVNDPNIYINAEHLNYVIRRRELASGLTESILGGWGSATAPQPSPDGRRLAFVRRVKEKTVLFVYDVATRRQRPVYDQLDRDVGADFVQQGAYYPRFGWFPDNRTIAIWGKGKLFRVDVDGGKAREIPFRAHTRHRITNAVRFPQDLAPRSFEVRVVREIAPAPDGKRVIFTALGRLWGAGWDGRDPGRLTSARGFEFDPAYSLDGRLLAYVEWNDEHGSVLKVIPVSGGAARIVAESRGVIRNPAFSPDSRQLAYRIQEADKAMGGYGTKKGIYLVAASGGASRFVTDGDEQPIFSPDGSRLYFIAVKYRDRQTIHQLLSVNLDGLGRREHAHTVDSDTLELRVSPDLRWIAFREHQQYYLMPYRETGWPLAVTARSAEVPVRQLTELGGYSLTWAADSSSVHWTLGAALYRSDVAGSMSSTPPPEPYARIALNIPVDAPKGSIAFTNARIITMKDDEVIERGTVVVEGNRILAVGPGDRIRVPSGANVIDATGKTVMPGLIDMHGHNDCCYTSGVAPQKQPARYAQLAFGVTTNFDPYSSELVNYETRETDLAGITVGPRWIGSGSPVYGRARKGDFTYVPIADYEDAQRVMQRKRALGGSVIKSYKQPARAQRQMLVKAGREAGIMVDVEGEGHFYNDITMILDGHTNLEHNLPVAKYYDDVVQLMSRAAISNTPTLVVAFGELYGENFMYQTERAWEHPKVKLYVQEVTSSYGALGVPGGAPPHARNMTSIHLADELWDVGFRGVSRSVKALDDAGVTINAGSHGNIAGLSQHWEMRLLAQGGMGNHRILRAATLNGARTLGLDGQIGSLEPGKLADLIVLDANPLEDIRGTDSVRYTMLNGRLYDALSMSEIGNYDRPRSRFYWERSDYHGIDWNDSWAGE